MTALAMLYKWMRSGSAVGLHLMDEHVGAVQVSQGAKGLRIDKIALEKREGEGQQERLRDYLLSQDLKGERVSTCLPISTACVREIPLDFNSPAKLKRIIKYQMEPYVPCTIDDMVVDCLKVGGKDRALTFAVEKRRLSEHLQTLSLAGLAPDQVGLDGLALFHLFLVCEEDGSDGPVAIVHLDREHMSVLIVSGKRLEMLRLLHGGADDPEQLVETFRLYRMREPESPVERVLLTGPLAVDPEMVKRIGKAVEVETALWKPFDALKNGHAPLGDEAQAFLSVALGLAVSGLGNGASAVNFLKEEFQIRNRQGFRSHFIFIGAALFTLAALLAFHGYRGLHDRERRYSEMRKEITLILKQTFPQMAHTMKGAEPALMGQKMAEEMQQYQWVESLGEGNTALDNLLLLTRLIAEHPGTSIETLSVEGKRISLEGRASSFQEVDSLKAGFAAAGPFKSVKIGGAKMDGQERIIRFGFVLERS